MIVRTEKKMKTAEAAIGSIGLGFDIAVDLRLKYCKRDADSLIHLQDDGDPGRDVVLPGISLPNVSKWIKCDKGERMRFTSDVLSFQQMSEQFNQEVSLSGKIPSGIFNAMYNFSGCWQKDAANTKALAFDGVFITLYSVALAKSQLVLRPHVKQAVPSSWDPAALASFIHNFGTHIIVGLKMGGKDVIYVKQQHSSLLHSSQVQKSLKHMADTRFTPMPMPMPNTNYYDHKPKTREQRLRFVDTSPSDSYSHKEDIVSISKRRGGSEDTSISHSEWIHTVQSQPDVISMSFIPITSLLNGVPGSGFLSHAINLYLRYKPPIEELHQFLEFQLPRQWAPVFSELPLGPQRKQQVNASLQFSFLGPKLYVNTSPVDVGKRPVTGVRLYLEGKKNNRLAIHLQHLSSLPKIFQLCNQQDSDVSSKDRRYYEKVGWKNFSHVCTAPVESDEDLSIVTGAQFQVGDYGLKKILFLRLCFSTLTGAAFVKKSEWDGSPSGGLGHKSGLISSLISSHFTTTALQKPAPRPADVNINSAVYPGGPPVPVQAPKLLKYVDTAEISRGPQETPGYWVVSGARLLVERGKISLRVKYSLLTVIIPDSSDNDLSD